MPIFQIRQGGTGAVLWTGAAANEIQAMDAMAHDAAPGEAVTSIVGRPSAATLI